MNYVEDMILTQCVLSNSPPLPALRLQRIHQLLELRNNLPLLLRLFLGLQPQHRPLLLCRYYLVLLPHPNRVHPVMSTAAHDVPRLLISFDLVRGEADLSSSRDTFAVLHVRGHGRAFAGEEGATVGARVDGFAVGSGGGEDGADFDVRVRVAPGRGVAVRRGGGFGVVFRIGDVWRFGAMTAASVTLV